MRTILSSQITENISEMCISANYNIPADVICALKKARQSEEWPIAQSVLDDILKNDEMAANENLPACQDTGMALVFLAIGQDLHIQGDLTEAVQEGVRRGYRDGYLRKSVVSDPLERVNTNDNTPALIYTEIVPGDRLGITVAPKGFGCENMSRLAMLKPSQGEDGIRKFILETICLAGPNACPPLVVGVGIGGSFDKAAEISKRALLREIGSRNPNPFYAKLEEELLHEANESGIGPQGFGGRTTVLALHIETLPTHIAALPCAVNINCHAARHESREI